MTQPILESLKSTARDRWAALRREAKKKGTKKLIKSYARSVFTLKQQQLHVPFLSVGAVFLILAGDSLIYGCYLGLIKYFNYGCKLHAFRFVFPVLVLAVRGHKVTVNRSYAVLLICFAVQRALRWKDQEFNFLRQLFNGRKDMSGSSWNVTGYHFQLRNVEQNSLH